MNHIVEASMSGIPKVVRGAVAVGLTFSVALGSLVTIITVIQWRLFGADFRHEMIDTVLTAAVPIGFLMGVMFFAVMVSTGGGRTLKELSRSRAAAAGAGVGFVLFLILWGGSYSSIWDDVVNGVLFAVMGGGIGIGTLALARLVGRDSESGDERPGSQ